jgi:hypothetical protein
MHLKRSKCSKLPHIIHVSKTLRNQVMDLLHMSLSHTSPSLHAVPASLHMRSPAAKTVNVCHLYFQNNYVTYKTYENIVDQV